VGRQAAAAGGREGELADVVRGRRDADDDETQSRAAGGRRRF
jgi:hypothetical protein